MVLRGLLLDPNKELPCEDNISAEPTRFGLGFELVLVTTFVPAVGMFTDKEFFTIFCCGVDGFMGPRWSGPFNALVVGGLFRGDNKL